MKQIMYDIGHLTDARRLGNSSILSDHGVANRN